jgi:hypothetical protein
MRALLIITILALSVASLPLTDDEYFKQYSLQRTLRALVRVTDPQGGFTNEASVLGESDDPEFPPHPSPHPLPSPTPEPEPEPRDPAPDTGYTKAQVVAAAIAGSLLLAYVAYLLIRLVYGALNEPGRGYFSVQSEEPLLPASVQRAAPAKKGSSLGDAFTKGKDKVTRIAGQAKESVTRNLKGTKDEISTAAKQTSDKATTIAGQAKEGVSKKVGGDGKPAIGNSGTK